MDSSFKYNAASDNEPTAVPVHGSFDQIFNNAGSAINEYLYQITYQSGREPDMIFTESVKNITGYLPSELASRPGGSLSIIHAEDAIRVRRQIADLESDPLQNYTSLIYRIISRSGDTVWIRDNVSVERGPAGSVEKLYGVVSDISELKNREAELEHSRAALKQLNAAKDKFISIISHDLRAPFTSILGFAEILLNEPNLPEDEKKEYLNYIYESSQTQLQLVKYLLDWSRIQTGKMKFEPRRLKARTVMQYCTNSITGNALRKNIDLRVNSPEEFFLYADEKLLIQIISNLLNNAVKFTPEGGSVEVSINRFKKGFIEIVVKDDGVGISEQNQAKLFKFDQKFSTEGTKGEKGSGLGLTLVKEIVEKHGGDIWFYSQPMQGSEFHFTIPEAKNTVLIVEDDPSILMLLSALVKKHLPGFEVLQTGNGYEAMNEVLKEMPSLIITDHNMPLMNGIQLIESLRKQEAGVNVPVIVIAASLPEDVKSKYSGMGVDSFLMKPLKVEEFNMSLSEAL